MVQDRLTITIPEAGRLLGIGRDAAYRAAKRGEIPTLRLGRRLVVPIAGLERMLQRPFMTRAISRSVDASKGRRAGRSRYDPTLAPALYEGSRE